jgi:nitroimidazol reductase NimA-like FMN-containing flavoprotein (pyridoxamine 5'-phosphate oxidase superfamily)
MSDAKPRFRQMSADEIIAVLRAHRFGRLAFSFHDRVDITPIHYVYDDGAIYGRSAPGAKVTVLEHHPWVALEVDEVHGDFDWRSVVVKGTVYFVEPAEAPAIEERYERALRFARRITPSAFMRDDPTPERSVLFRLHIDEMTGRAAESS